MRQEIEKYVNRLRVLARSPETIGNFRRVLRRHVLWLEQRNILEAKSVRLSHLERYARQLLQWHAVNCARSRIQLLRRFYGWLEQQKVIGENPAKGLGVPKRVEPLPPSPPDAATVYKVIGNIDAKGPVGKRNRAILEVFFSTGLRRSEFLGLELGDVRLKDRTIMVRAGKGNKDRVVLLSGRACRALSLYMEQARPLLADGLPGQEAWAEHCRCNGKAPDKLLWLAAHGGPLIKVTLNNYFKQWAADIGQRFHPHLLRHAFAVHLLRRGADIRHVQALLGHESLDTTKIYLRLVKEDYKREYDRAFPLIKVRF